VADELISIPKQCRLRSMTVDRATVHKLNKAPSGTIEPSLPSPLAMSGNDTEGAGDYRETAARKCQTRVAT
jgi:hypothetical protein